MTDPFQHYKQAEADIERAKGCYPEDGIYYLHRAQAHATLALVDVLVAVNSTNTYTVYGGQTKGDQE